MVSPAPPRNPFNDPGNLLNLKGRACDVVHESKRLRAMD